MANGSDMEALLHAAPADSPAQADLWSAPAPGPAPVSVSTLHDHIAEQATVSPAAGEEPAPGPEEAATLVGAVLREIAAEDDCTFQGAAALFQDFTVRCRMRGVKDHGLDAAQFRRRLSIALAGLEPDPGDEPGSRLIELAETVPDELVTPFLAIGRAALRGEACPDDEALAVLYGTRSVGRARRMLDHLERSDLIEVRTDFSGRRSVAIPRLNLATAPG
jgi:hypothetical protein